MNASATFTSAPKNSQQLAHLNLYEYCFRESQIQNKPLSAEKME